MMLQTMMILSLYYRTVRILPIGCSNQVTFQRPNRRPGLHIRKPGMIDYGRNPFA